MTPESQRIAIAEACGWKPQHNYYWLAPNTDYPLISGGNLPDYLNDLNAMHEAEKVLGEDDLAEYCEVLQDICRNCNAAITAPAAQRAEAFLRTLGLWKDDK